LEGKDLATWDGRTGMPPGQVDAIFVEVRGILGEMRGPLGNFSELVSNELGAQVAVPVLDDLGIASRDLERALDQLPLAAQAHADHLLHTGGCKHNNDPMRIAVELVRDVSATLSLVEGTFQLFGVIQNQ
jgi:hypothetical protein